MDGCSDFSPDVDGLWVATAARAATAPEPPLGARVSEGRLLEAAVFALRVFDVDGLRVVAAARAAA
eukprot:SAG31_NODE_24260_length_485_cov_1.424870_1_plen_65_part_01